MPTSDNDSFNQMKDELLAPLKTKNEQLEKSHAEQVLEIVKLRNVIKQLHEKNRALVADNENLEQQLSAMQYDLELSNEYNKQLSNKLDEFKSITKQAVDIRDGIRDAAQKVNKELEDNEKLIGSYLSRIHNLSEIVQTLYLLRLAEGKINLVRNNLVDSCYNINHSNIGYLTVLVAEIKSLNEKLKSLGYDPEGEESYEIS